MSSLAAGIDAIEINRVKEVLDHHGERFLHRVFTDLEIAFCRGRVRELAVRFAAKEAMMKALGTGVRGVGWRDIEICRTVVVSRWFIYTTVLASAPRA